MSSFECSSIHSPCFLIIHVFVANKIVIISEGLTATPHIFEALSKMCYRWDWQSFLSCKHFWHFLKPHTLMAHRREGKEIRMRNSKEKNSPKEKLPENSPEYWLHISWDLKTQHCCKSRLLNTKRTHRFFEVNNVRRLNKGDMQSAIERLLTWQYLDSLINVKL